MNEENISEQYQLKNIDETRNFIEEIKQNNLISKKHKKICRVLSYIEHLITLVFTVSGCVSISGFAFLLFWFVFL